MRTTASRLKPRGSLSRHSETISSRSCDRVYVRPQGDDGRELNAEFAVEADGPHLSLVLESAGGRSRNDGPSRNHEYVAALTLLLRRLADRRAVLMEVLLASRRVSHMPKSQRTLASGPIELAGIVDFEQLRLNITTAQGRMGQQQDATKEGNNRKRIQLRLAVPGYGPDDASRLGAELASRTVSPDQPISVDANGFGRDDLMSAVDQLARHRQSGLHKPLALLWTIGRLAHDQGRLAPWPLFREGVGQLLAEWAVGPHSDNTPEYPFWHLRTSAGLWEVHGVSQPPGRADTTATAGLTQRAAELLQDPVFCMRVVTLLVDRYLSSIADTGLLLHQLGLAQSHSPIPSAQELLKSLLGREIRTATGQPNTVLALEPTDVLVATTASPEGSLVPIHDVQHGLDQLSAHRAVRLHPTELGYRSSFVGAVLATLPNARFVEDPTRVILEDQRQTWITGEMEPVDAGASLPVTINVRGGRGTGYAQDVSLRRALEIHAVDWTMLHYEGKGYDVYNVGASRPYDVLALRGTEELHIEVKGSSIEDVASVELTRGEVNHGRMSTTHLVVVDGIRWQRLPSGQIRTYEGRARIWRTWSPVPDSLEPTRYRHSVPNDPDENHPVT